MNSDPATTERAREWAKDRLAVEVECDLDDGAPCSLCLEERQAATDVLALASALEDAERERNVSVGNLMAEVELVEARATREWQRAEAVEAELAEVREQNQQLHDALELIANGGYGDASVKARAVLAEGAYEENAGRKCCEQS